MLVIAIIGVVLVGLFFAALESEPAVQVASHRQIDEADSVGQLLEQLRNTLRRRNYTQSIVLNEAQLTSLVGLAKRALPAFSGQVDLAHGRSRLALSYRLPPWLMSRYLNVSLAVGEGNQLNIDRVDVGPFALPGDWVLGALVWYGDWHTNSDIASQFIAHIDKVRMSHDYVIITFDPLDQFLRQLNHVKNGLSGSQDEDLRLRTAFYLTLLSEMPEAHKLAPVSLSRYMAPLFTRVVARSETADPVRENQAALLALAIFAGHHRLANLVGDVQPNPDIVALPRYRPVLANRTDLTQHLLVSAAIQIMSYQGVSTAIGEFKELMDRARGGSGYSFVDLAADMAGVKLAEQISMPETAKEIQVYLASLQDEAALFPDIHGLPEGLSKQHFQERYGQVDSPAYKQQIADIEARLQNLFLYAYQPNSVSG